MSIEFKFSSCIYRKRIEAGYTQAQVAEAIGVTTRSYQNYEKGSRLPKTIVFLSLVKLLDIDVSDLFDEVDVVLDYLPKPKKDNSTGK